MVLGFEGPAATFGGIFDFGGIVDFGGMVDFRGIVVLEGPALVERNVVEILFLGSGGGCSFECITMGSEWDFPILLSAFLLGGAGGIDEAGFFLIVLGR